jgi:metal-responsive CopG/Arc/MetJ family transcriptional regulator
MTRTKSNDNVKKYTVVLPESSINELKELSEKNIIDSISAGIREAVAEYLVKVKRDTYRKELEDAVKDPEFINRNNEVVENFKYADEQTEEMMHKW